MTNIEPKIGGCQDVRNERNKRDVTKAIAKPIHPVRQPKFWRLQLPEPNLLAILLLK